VIVVDTSAIMAVVLDEPRAEECLSVLGREHEVLISAGTLAELMIVAGTRGRLEEVETLIDGLGFEVVPVTSAVARRAAGAHRKWGKGVHPASLNFGDCFAYELAKSRGCSLLYVGNDFGKTDIESALSA